MNQKTINILLLSPGASSNTYISFGNQHLVSLGSAVKEWTGAHITIVDLDYEAYLPVSQRQNIFSQDFDLVGISCYSSFDYLKSFYIGAEIRKHHPSVCLVVGGYHPSARPEDFLTGESPFNYVVKGEGELPLTRIVKSLQTGDPINENILGPEPVAELDQLPPLDWNLMDRYLPVAAKRGDEVAIALSRGCAFKCSFCMEAAKGSDKWRPFSTKRAEQELRRFHEWINLDGRKLFLTDPLFGFNPGWRREMLQRIKTLNLPTDSIWALSRADILQEEDIQLFKDARFGLGFGLESGDPRMLELVHKGGDTSKYLERFAHLTRFASKTGVPWGANIIVGHPGETPETMERSAQWITGFFKNTSPLTGFLAVDPYRFYPGSPIDHNRSYYEKEFGTVFHWPQWWNYSEPDFTATWIDPSRSLDFRTRERMTAELFMPVIHHIAENFSFDGYAADYYKRSSLSPLEYFRNRNRVRTIRLSYLWEGLTGGEKRDARLDKEAAALLKEERTRSIDNIIKQSGPLHPELRQALIDVPRERFVDEEYLKDSARDTTLPLLPDNSSTISAIHAYAVNYKYLELQPGDNFLELGGGTGYGAAIASRLVSPEGKVKSLEIEPALVEKGKANLREYPNAEIVCRGETDLAKETAEGFNKILYCYALDKLPRGLDTLPLGGRLLAPVRSEKGKQMLTMVEQTVTGIKITPLQTVLYVADKTR